MTRLFRLLRCGRLEDARQLCHHVGQPWRAASLGSAGGLGLTPLGKREVVIAPGMHLYHRDISADLCAASAQSTLSCHTGLCSLTSQV